MLMDTSLSHLDPIPARCYAASSTGSIAIKYCSSSVDQRHVFIRQKQEQIISAPVDYVLRLPISKILVQHTVGNIQQQSECLKVIVQESNQSFLLLLTVANSFLRHRETEQFA